MDLKNMTEDDFLESVVKLLQLWCPQDGLSLN